ncbi:tRNA 2-thiouridine(34) synthase MnmA [Candidatus Gracilibacteria bacterium]|nr:tRNA 2-thiouridine(34) synthase MnmA [Candidatus Gracilibacteria bacterium]
MNKKILVGLSGGVDSAVAAYLLKQSGADVTAGFMINYLAPEGEHCPTREDIEVAREVAAFLDIPFFTFDFREEYEHKVLNYMYEGYQKGITPNPDIMCNSEVKFKVFLDEALEAGFDMVATGHYARIEPSPPTPLPRGEGSIVHLLKGVDQNKDQSYFLAGLNQFQLSHSLFPIGHLEKSEVRQIALDAGLPNARRKESQGICFVGKVNMSDFLEKKIKPKPGLVKDTSGKVLGEHKGVFYYTVGQRKGLDIGGQPEPIFIVRKDIEKNEIIVGYGSDDGLYGNTLIMSHTNIINQTYHKKDHFTASAKIRYRQADQDCSVEKIGEGRYKVTFKNDQRAIASGQICVVYIGDELVMSGVIE